VDEAVDVARAEDAAPAELKEVPTGPVLAVAGGQRPPQGGDVVAAHEVEERRGPEADRPVRGPPLVDEERKRDAGLLAERARVAVVAEPDHGEAHIGRLEGRLVRAQLRDVLAAEDSAEVAEEHEDGGSRRPQRAEPHRGAVGVGERDVGQRGSA
jgi:hypothetical protein